MKTFSTYFKTFLAAMLLLVGSNYVGAAEPNWTDYAVVPEVGKNYYILRQRKEEIKRCCLSLKAVLHQGIIKLRLLIHSVARRGT